MDMRVPDIGGFSDVVVIEVHVGPGDTVAVDDPVITLESDKATMDVPASAAGVVSALNVAVGDRVSQGNVILTYDPGGAERAEQPTPGGPAAQTSGAPSEVGYDSPGDAYPFPDADRPASVGAPPTRTAASPPTRGNDVTCQILVLGAGPGGYTAAFRAADLGRSVVLVDAGEALGGVCLNIGCIPSKALLHAARVLCETREMSEHGLRFEPPSIDLDVLRTWKTDVVRRLTGGLATLARQRKVRTIRGVGRFVSARQLEVTTSEGITQLVGFESAIIAAGSEPVRLPFVPHDDPRVLDSTGALELADVPQRLLVIGGGIIGLEMATVYSELGSAITVVELMDQLIPGADADVVAPLLKRIRGRYENVLLATKVTQVQATSAGLQVSFEGAGAPAKDVFDKVLVAVGRRPNGKTIGAEAAGVVVDDRGFVPVDSQMRTNVAHIFAIGDVVGQPMLAHKATHEGKVAAEAATGLPSHFDARVIPSVAYTDPEVAWVGVTEAEARAEGIDMRTGAFPWVASGRNLSLGRSDGMTKVIVEEGTDRVLGCGIVGTSAGELVAEAALAIEMGCDAADIGLTIHPHPTLSETVGMAAEILEGTITDLYLPRAAVRAAR